MLSIKFGYGRPAALAEAFAAAFFFGLSFLDFFLGFGVSQTGLGFIISTLLRLIVRRAHLTLHDALLQVIVPHDVAQWLLVPVWIPRFRM